MHTIDSLPLEDGRTIRPSSSLNSEILASSIPSHITLQLHSVQSSTRNKSALTSTVDVDGEVDKGHPHSGVQTNTPAPSVRTQDIEMAGDDGQLLMKSPVGHTSSAHEDRQGSTVRETFDGESADAETNASSLDIDAARFPTNRTPDSDGEDELIDEDGLVSGVDADGEREDDLPVVRKRNTRKSSGIAPRRNPRRVAGKTTVQDEPDSSNPTLPTPLSNVRTGRQEHSKAKKAKSTLPAYSDSPSSFTWKSMKYEFRSNDYVFDHPLWRMEDSDIVVCNSISNSIDRISYAVFKLEPDVAIQAQFFAARVGPPKDVLPVQTAPIEKSEPAPLQGEGSDRMDGPPIEVPPVQIAPTDNSETTPPLVEGADRMDEDTPSRCDAGQVQHEGDSDTDIFWEKQPILNIPIPTTRHDVMVDLAAVIQSAERRHNQEQFSLRPKDKLLVFSQSKWASMNGEDRRRAFAQGNILVKHDKSSAAHPVPIFPDIKEWSRAQIGQYFDLYAYRFMQEQAWASDFVRSLVGKEAKPIPQYALVDNGKRKAFEDKLKGKKLLGPTFLSKPSVKEPVYRRFMNGLVRKDVTLADCRNSPRFRLRCASLDMFIQNKLRHEDLANTRDSTVQNSQHVRSPSINNFLDIPMAGSAVYASPSDGLDPFPNLSSTNTPFHPLSSSIPQDDLKWALCGSKWAISDAHVDAAGFGTHIRPILGKKIWFVAVPDSERPEACVVSREKELLLGAKIDELRRSKRHLKPNYKPVNAYPRHRTIGGKERVRPFVSMKSGFQVTAMRWVAVVLEEGDDL